MGKGLSKKNKELYEDLDYSNLQDYLYIAFIRQNYQGKTGTKVVTKFYDVDRGVQNVIGSTKKWYEALPNVFTETIIPRLKDCVNLQELHLIECEINNKEFSNIFTKYMGKDEPPLTTLTMKSNSFDNITPFCDWLKNNNRLVHLDLSDNQIVDISCIGIALKTNKTLTTLDLSDNQIVDVSSIGEALESNKTLTTLLLAKNRIICCVNRGNDDNGYPIVVPNSTSIKNALKNNRTLTELDLGGMKHLIDGDPEDTTLEEFLKSIEKATNRNKEIVNNKFMFHYELKF